MNVALPDGAIGGIFPRSLVQIADFINAAAPSLFFGGSGGSPLSVGIAGRVRFLRLGLHGAGPLHLFHVEVRDRSGAMNLHPRQVTASSLYGMSDKSPREQKQALQARALSLLYYPVVGGDGLHTADEDTTPWVQIDLQRPTTVESIRIRNRTDVWACRNWSLTVEASEDGQDWRAVYDHRAVVDAVSVLVEQQIANAASPEQGRAFHLYWRTLRVFLSGAIIEHAFFDTLSISDDERGILGDVLNTRLLYRFQQEITAHGMARTFRYWSADEKKKYVEDALAIVDALKDLSPHVMIGYGAVLSYIRSGDLMPHDDDIDVVIAMDQAAFADIPAATRAVSAFLTERGFRLDGDFFSHRWVAARDDKTLDVFVGLYSGDTVRFYPGPPGGCAIVDVFPTIPVRLCDCIVPIPANPFRYVEAIYGPSWRIPQPLFSHDWNEDAFA
ncbi:discoidin domain-containing protein [Gluconacetobacter azotocaptans]|uniref:Discoidin domain-containing protein n=1 Tax=Gluconacetobacter azotocaptans TaxID=142834 RepID=A0A7W4JPU5_9PROT|nr:discoidin domain-containing protein [Gluconacetobacter azotocaptans]MBB2188643.1 discoidin domain-containing protein [Gluconacetobacter azotocaptans]MBM9400405.1 discoidin domain-containing protein [Gluconacetobacter azotocaptans]GBQ35246.1 hypothetical protein AA13594_3071 [Gluconacetobacter azotocaptans DSM 13594]